PPENAKAQPSAKYSGLRLSVTASRRQTAFFRFFQFVSTPPFQAVFACISPTTESMSRRAIEILLGSFGNCNTLNHFASSISPACGRISPDTHSQTNAIMSEFGNGQGWLAKERILRTHSPATSSAHTTRDCSSD